MPSDEDPGHAENAGAKAREAVRLGTTLDADHLSDPGAVRSIGTCMVCGILSYQAGDGSWKHVPAIEECDGVDRWIQQHQGMAVASSSSKP